MKSKLAAEDTARPPAEPGARPDPKSAAGTRIQSVARGCQLLLWLAERPHGATAKEAAFATRIALPTTYHLLNTLVDQGLLAKDVRRHYVLGPGAAILAQAYLRGSSVPETLLSALREVASRTGETAYLADWGEYEIRVLGSVEGSNMVRVAEVASGRYEDAHARANGKVLLAYAWPEVRSSYLERHPISRRTANTICDPADLTRELALVRERGYAYDEQEFCEGVCCVAVPVIRDRGIVAALGLSVPAERFEKTREQLTRTLLDVTAAIDTPESDSSAERAGG